MEDREEKEKSEIAAMNIVMKYEKNRGWEPEDVSSQKIGFDIRSLSPADSSTGYRKVRRIEVKGRRKGQPRLIDENVIKKAIARGVQEGLFRYVGDKSKANFAEGKLQVPKQWLRFNYYKPRGDAKVARFNELKDFQVYMGGLNPYFNDVQSMANAYKHLYTNSGRAYVTVESGGAIYVGEATGNSDSIEEEDLEGAEN